MWTRDCRKNCSRHIRGDKHLFYTIFLPDVIPLSNIIMQWWTICVSSFRRDCWMRVIQRQVYSKSILLNLVGENRDDFPNRAESSHIRKRRISRHSVISNFPRRLTKELRSMPIIPIADAFNGAWNVRRSGRRKNAQTIRHTCGRRLAWHDRGHVISGRTVN